MYTAMWFYLYLCNTSIELCTFMVISMRQKTLDSKVINICYLQKIATYLMSTSKFQGVTLVYCME